MFKKTIQTTLLATAILSAGLAHAQNVAIVNGKAIESGLLDYIMAEQAKRGNPSSPEMRAQVRDQMITQEVLRQEAVKKGMASKDAVKYQSKLAEQAILVQALQQDFFENHQISDDEMQKTYDTISQQMQGSEYRSSHILVEDEKLAKELIAKLDDGADFAALAGENSKDPGSAANGGDLNWADPQAFVPEFSQAMVELEKGQYTKEPVQSQFGFHIIKLTDVRDMAAPPLSEIKDQLRERMLGAKWEEYIDGLKQDAMIK